MLNYFLETIDMTVVFKKESKLGFLRESHVCDPPLYPDHGGCTSHYVIPSLFSSVPPTASSGEAKM